MACNEANADILLGGCLTQLGIFDKHGAHARLVTFGLFVANETRSAFTTLPSHDFKATGLAFYGGSIIGLAVRRTVWFDGLRDNADVVARRPPDRLPECDAALVLIENEDVTLLNACMLQSMKAPLDEPATN